MRIDRTGVIAAGLMLCLNGGVQADNRTCAGAILLVPDGSSHSGDLPNAPSSRWFRFVGKAGRSYALMLENLTPPDQQSEIAVADAVSSCGGPSLNPRDGLDFIEPVSISCLAEPNFCGATRSSLKIAADTDAFFPVIQIGSTNGAQFRLRVEETTLFNPFWTTVGLETFYRIHNASNGSCAVTLDLRTDTNGPPAGGTSTTTFTLAGNNSLTRTTGPGDLNLADGQTGHATLAHDCPPGAIQVDGFLSGGGKLLPVKVTTARQQR